MADRFLSLPYLFLRSSTAGGALLFGLIQTFVFARVLSPERFSVFILIGTLGITLWLVDFGLTRILFVRQREAFLADRKDPVITGQSLAVMCVYTAAALAGTIICFVITAASASPLLHAVEFALFFLFVALNLVWFVVRFVSVAVDQFVFFETHEAIRRIGHIGLMLLMLAGLPLIAFLVLANLVWLALFASAIRRLLKLGAISRPHNGFLQTMLTFFRSNKSEAMRMGAFSAADMYISNFAYFVVPFAFGLGAPTIILDTTFKIYRGAAILYAAGSDVAVPRQTRALADRDRKTLIKTTLMAAGLCSLPALALCVVLLVAGEKLFALLLGPAATMPAAATPILIVLLLANVAQTVSNSLLLHTGYFRQLATIAAGLAVAMTIMSGIVVFLGLDLTGFLWGYAITFAASVVFSVAALIWGPIRESGS